MRTDKPAVRPTAGQRRLCLRTGLPATRAIAAVAAVFLVTAGGWFVWSFRARLDTRRNAEMDKLRTIGRSLASAAEALMSGDDLSTLRQMVAQADVQDVLESCRVALPDGQVVANSESQDASVRELPATWAGDPAEYSETVSGHYITMTWPITVPNRGSAVLAIKAATAGWTEGDLQAQSGLVALSGAGLVALLVVYRLALARFRALAGIGQAITDIRNGETSAQALEVSPRLGPEAEVWNDLLQDREQLRKQSLLGEARQAFQSGQEAGGAIGLACDGLPYGLVLVDADRRVRYANGAAAVFLHTTPDALAGAEVSRFVADQRVLEALGTPQDRGACRRAVVEIRRAESEGGGVLRCVVRPVRRGDAGSAMIVIEDITQQRVAEEARNTFLAQVTHELRTPLANISLHVKTALAAGEDQPATRIKCLNVINEESGRLERMVSDMLSISEIEAGSFRMSRDDVRFDVLLEQLKTDYAPQARDKQIDLVFSLPAKLPVIQADRDKIALAMHNLIGNAIKYTPPGGQVTVNASVDHNQLAVDVTDTGIGVSSHELGRIFEKFYRAKDQRVAEVPGSGMGLALAREVARLHGGDIAVQSELDKGSNFTMTLPLSTEAA